MCVEGRISQGAQTVKLKIVQITVVMPVTYLSSSNVLFCLLMFDTKDVWLFREERVMSVKIKKGLHPASPTDCLSLDHGKWCMKSTHILMFHPLRHIFKRRVEDL